MAMYKVHWKKFIAEITTKSKEEQETAKKVILKSQNKFKKIIDQYLSNFSFLFNSSLGLQIASK